MASAKSAREIIRERLGELSLSMNRVSEDLGMNRAYLQQYLERGTPAELPERQREALAKLLGISEHALKTGGASALTKKASPRAKSSAAPTHTRRVSRIPVLGIAEGGEEGWSIWNGDTVDVVPAPGSLEGAKQAYAVYVVGSSMEPRYFAGELIYANPAKPVTPGSFVIMQVRARNEDEPPRALIKRLAKRLAHKVVLEQFNPSRTFEVALKDIVSMHRIVGTAE